MGAAGRMLTVKVLLVTADPDVRTQMQVAARALRRRMDAADGLELLEAADGDRGARIAWRERPDVVLADEITSRAGAFALTKELKGADPPFAGRVIILLERLAGRMAGGVVGGRRMAGEAGRPVPARRPGGGGSRGEGGRVKIKVVHVVCGREVLVHQILGVAGSLPLGREAVQQGLHRGPGGSARGGRAVRLAARDRPGAGRADGGSHDHRGGLDPRPPPRAAREAESRRRGRAREPVMAGTEEPTTPFARSGGRTAGRCASSNPDGSVALVRPVPTRTRRGRSRRRCIQHLGWLSSGSSATTTG